MKHKEGKESKILRVTKLQIHTSGPFFISSGNFSGPDIKIVNLKNKSAVRSSKTVNMFCQLVF